jgi:hypothetical protein
MIFFCNRIVAVDQPGLDLGHDPDISAGGIKTTNHVKGHGIDDFQFQVFGIGTPGDGFAAKQIQGGGNGVFLGVGGRNHSSTNSPPARWRFSAPYRQKGSPRRWCGPDRRRWHWPPSSGEPPSTRTITQSRANPFGEPGCRPAQHQNLPGLQAMAFPQFVDRIDRFGVDPMRSSDRPHPEWSGRPAQKSGWPHPGDRFPGHRPPPGLPSLAFSRSPPSPMPRTNMASVGVGTGPPYAMAMPSRSGPI